MNPQENAIDGASPQVHHFWPGATQNRAGRWCFSLYVSGCFKITGFQEELQLKWFPTSLKETWVQRGALWESEKEERKRKKTTRMHNKAGSRAEV